MSLPPSQYGANARRRDYEATPQYAEAVPMSQYGEVYAVVAGPLPNCRGVSGNFGKHPVMAAVYVGVASKGRLV